MVYEAIRQAEAECGPFELREIDIAQQPEAVREYGVVATPSVVINGHLAFSGVPKANKLIDRLRSATPS